MSAYHTDPSMVRLDDIRTNVSAGNEALLTLIESLETTGHDLTEDAKLSYRLFSKSLEHRRLKKIVNLKISNYSAGTLTLQDIRQSNFDWKDRMNARRRGNEPEYKINAPKDVSNEGKTTIFSYQRNRVVTARYDSLIKEELFKQCIVRYNFGKESVVLLIPSLFNCFSTASELGISRGRLGEVLEIYCNLSLPSLKGQMSRDASCLNANIDTLLEVISLDSERKKLEQQLDSVTRSPGTPLDSFVHTLYTLYSAAITLDTLADDSVEDADLHTLLDGQLNPAQVTRHTQINDQVQVLLHNALRSLCSTQAQHNVSLLIRERGSRFPFDVLKEVINKCDAKNPLRSLIKLPSSLIYLSAHDNVDINPSLEVLTAAFGSFQRPSSGSPGSRPPSPGGQHRPPSPNGDHKYHQRPPSPKPPYQGAEKRPPSPRTYSGNRLPGYQSNQGPPRQSGWQPTNGGNRSYEKFRYKSSGSGAPQYRPRSQDKNSYSTPSTPYRPSSRGEQRGQSRSPGRRSPGRDRGRDPSKRPPSPGGTYRGQQRSSSASRQGYQQRPSTPPRPNSRPQSPSRPPSRQGSRGSRTPSPSSWRHAYAYYLDKVTLPQVQANYRLKFCARCGSQNHLHEKCPTYSGQLQSRCRFCSMYHSTKDCVQSPLAQTSQSLFPKYSKKN